MRPSRLVATFGGVGLLRPMPGTWGSAAALPVGYALHGLGGFPLLLTAAVVVFAIGWRVTILEERASGTHDAGEIVIDEVVGIWIALMPVSAGLNHAGVDPWVFPWPGWIGAFVMFRLFDIWKPGPVGWADSRPGAFGVMFDDVIAGIFAAITVALMAGIAHGLMGL